jgi:hypothetical protein
MRNLRRMAVARCEFEGLIELLEPIMGVEVELWIKVMILQFPDDIADLIRFTRYTRRRKKSTESKYNEGK